MMSCTDVSDQISAEFNLLCCVSDFLALQYTEYRHLIIQITDFHADNRGSIISVYSR